MRERPDVRIVDDFYAPHRALFETLVETVSWERSMTARLTASYGRPYNYRQMVYPEAPMHEALVPVVEQPEAEVGVRFDNCLLNYYPDGRSKMGFHADDVDELVPGTGVAIVSLGNPRRITFRRQDDASVRWGKDLAPGSLLFMPQAVQHEWVHAIKRQRRAEPRISLTWRALR